MDRHSEHRNSNPVSRRPSGQRGISPFVGRDGELRRLITALSLAAEGQGRIIFLTGQPGIGKTRLAREALALAKKRSFTVLEGRALLLEGELAYAPVVNAFGPLLRRLETDHLAALVDGLPDLGRLFGGLHLPPSILPLEGLGDPALEKTRLFEAVSRLLERLTQEAPVALFIDDLQWADPATIDLLHYLARGLADLRALLLATYNEDASNASRGLQSLIGSLDRNGLAEEVVVPLLEPEAVNNLVRGILGGEAPSDLMALLDVRAGGMPLFVEALVAALIDFGHLVRSPTEKDCWVLGPDGARALPPSIRRLILTRLRRLEPSDRRVLDLIAIMGDVAYHETLRIASSLEEECLLKSLRRLRATGLVVDEAVGLDVAYGITHPLVQEVVYAELPEIERRRAHVAAIRALESIPQGPLANVNRLARHYQGAGSEADPGRALSVLLAAGDRALDLFANEEAARHYAVALELLRGGPGFGFPTTLPCPVTPNTLPSLLERLGEAWERIGKRGAAVDVWNQALAERERDGNALAASRLHSQLALAEWDRGHFDVANAHLSAGLAMLAGGKPCQELADLHYTRFHILYRLGDAEGVADTAAELLSLARRLGSQRSEAEAHLVAALSSLWQRDVANAREYALQALTVSEQARVLDIWSRAHNVLGVIGMYLGDHDFVRYHAEHGLAVAQQLGAPDMEVRLQHYLALAHFMSGTWDESLRLSTAAVVLARRIGQPRDLAYSLAGQAMILSYRGDLSEAEACINAARMAFGSPSHEGPADRPIFSLIDIAETTIAIERAQIKRALDIAIGFARQVESWEKEPARLTLAFEPTGLMLLAEVQAAAGEPQSALETARLIIGLGPCDTPHLIALASRAEGLARQALGQSEAAIDCLARAHEKFVGLRMPFEAGRCLLDQSTSAATARPELAVRTAQQSLAIFERLDARRHADRARRILKGYGISPIATRRPHLGSVAISERELEIARLVAQGLTKAEIAKRLTLSPLTVGSHLHRIYERLGIHSRTALTRLVIEAGLLPPHNNITA
ncbi:MAG: AAA family ATPase [Dehalococcoidia bacterium]|nr:AAA family ATPase [Dehalococcoidia bacterium]